MTKQISRIVGAAICLLSAGCVFEKEEPEWSLGIGDAIPYFEVTLNDGTSITSSDLIGHESSITFFNTSCPDCQRELPELQRQYELHRDSVIFICIAREEDEESIQKYWNQNGLTIPYSAQPNRKVFNLFATQGIPRTYLISPAGTIVNVLMAM